MEAIYEPPQKGEMNGVIELDDKKEAMVDAIAENLNFRRVGWIFTTIDPDLYLTSAEVEKMAKLQHKYCVEHPCGANISMFVTIKAKVISDKGETGLEAAMVSDQCQAMVRDGVFGEIKEKSSFTIRKPGRYFKIKLIQ